MFQFISQMLIILVLFTLTQGKLSAQAKVILESGDTIVIKSNGTWEPYRQKDSTQSFVFRKTIWGMSKKEVKHNEKSILVNEDDNSLVYSGVLGKDSCIITYYFFNDEVELDRGRYQLIYDECSVLGIWGKFMGFYFALNQKYGVPEKYSEKVFFDENMPFDSLISNPDLFCSTLFSGNGFVMFLWSHNNTTISLALSGGPFSGIEGIDITIEYSNNEESLKENIEQLKLLEDL
ncbi:MAG: hypothetical protein R3F48_03360 [Candidatus Zixiibacteriota bacterium]